jgi:YfiH family protein
MVSLAEGLVEPSAPGGRPARWAATGRSGGVSAEPYATLNLADYVGDDPAAVAENRARLAGALSLPATALAIMGAVHGADLAVVDGPGTVPGVDALLTQSSDLALVALGADCIPLAIIGADGRTVAAVHCGWRGFVADVVGVAVNAMRDHGTDVALVVLGPSACGSCYAVPADRAAEVRARTSPRVGAAALTLTTDGQPGIDLRLGVRARLAELGVEASIITDAGGCTIEDPSLFSYRRDDRTGRQGIAVCTVGGLR